MLTWLMVAALPAHGKIPPFTVTVEPNPSVAGEQTTIVAEFEVSFPVERLTGLLILYRSSDQGDGREEIAITLERVTPTRFEATVFLSEPGRWVVKAFPDRTGWSDREVPQGFPDTIEFDVSAPTACWSPGQCSSGQIWLGAAVVALLGIIGLRGWL